MSVTVKSSCPFYTNRKQCYGDVTFEAGFVYGVCQKCGRAVPLIIEV